MDSRRLNSGVADEEAKLREKHQVLLHEYLVLQKECVLKKRKLNESKERKVTLLDEIRFLKHRRSFLLKNKVQKFEKQTEVAQSHRTDAKYKAESSRRYMNGMASTSTSTSGQAFQHHRPPIAPLRNKGTGGKEVVDFPPLNMGKKTKNLVTNGKQAEKRKIYWQDQLALKV